MLVGRPSLAASGGGHGGSPYLEYWKVYLGPGVSGRDLAIVMVDEKERTEASPPVQAKPAL